MITSMTGFASVTVPLLDDGKEQCQLDIEIKTFNSRFFEPACKLPGNLAAHEMSIVSRLKKAFHRGRVYCTVRVSGYTALLEKLVFLPTRFAEYQEISRRMKEEFKVTGDLTIDSAINLPNIFSTERSPIPDDAIERFLAGVNAAIDLAVETRVREGQNMYTDLAIRFGRCAELIDKVKDANLNLLEKCKKEISKLQALAQNGDENARSSLADRYSMLDKIDVHEELVRFTSHLGAVSESLNNKKPEKGRKLDFILQELMREINTIMAKCSSYEVSTFAVDIKVELEKAREQVQNVV